MYIGVDEYYFGLAGANDLWFSCWYHLRLGHAVFGYHKAMGLHYFWGKSRRAFILVTVAGENERQHCYGKYGLCFRNHSCDQMQGKQSLFDCQLFLLSETGITYY